MRNFAFAFRALVASIATNFLLIPLIEQASWGQAEVIRRQAPSCSPTELRTRGIPSRRCRPRPNRSTRRRADPDRPDAPSIPATETPAVVASVPTSPPRPPPIPDVVEVSDDSLTPSEAEAERASAPTVEASSESSRLVEQPGDATPRAGATREETEQTEEPVVTVRAGPQAGEGQAVPEPSGAPVSTAWNPLPRRWRWTSCQCQVSRPHSRQTRS